MKTQTVQNINHTPREYDYAILSFLPFPALFFNLASLTILKSNSFFCNESGCYIIPVLVKYEFDFLDVDDFNQICKTLSANQNYLVHKQFKTTEGIKTFEVSAHLLPDNINAFLYINYKFGKNGENECFDGIIEDITDNVTLKNELKQARDKALEADRLKSTFLTNMSHEIRTPMNSILGFSSMLKRKGIPYHKREQYLDIILSRGKHLMQILNDILDITRIEGDQVKVNPSSLVLNDFLDELYQDIVEELTSMGKNIELIVQTPLSHEHSLIITDNLHLHRVFTNLLNNSIKFTEKGTIEFGYILDRENKIVFYVKDTGIGISSELHETVFQRFRQVDESFTRIHGGLGLGLSICRGLIKLMGGEIWVESNVKNGSIFYFTMNYSLKKDENHHSEDPIVQENLSIWKNKLILIVEDDPASYEYLNEILSLVGCNVLHAANGKEAMDILGKADIIDLVLLDIQLPEMDGYQLTKNIRLNHPKVPIIAQTAHAMSENKRMCIEAGCTGYIAKPISYDLLMDTLKKYLG